MSREGAATELARYAQPEREKKPEPIGYKEPETGKVVPVFHPEILGEPGDSKALIDFDAKIQVQLADKKVVTTFGDYLLMNGITYRNYKESFDPETNNGKLARQLHQQIIDERLAFAIAAEKRETNDAEGLKRTKKDVEVFVIHLMNDTGYGEAFEATSQSDNKDKIDFFVKINPEDFDMDGEPVYFGIQHTVSQKKLDQKLEMASNRRSIYIPEHPEYGKVTNVVIHDNVENFFPNGGALSHQHTLNQIKREQHRNPKAYEAFMYDAGAKRNKTTSEDAKIEATQRAYKIFQSILEGVNDYLKYENSPAVKKDLTGKQEIVRKVIEVMEEDMPEIKEANHAF